MAKSRNTLTNEIKQSNTRENLE